MAKPGPRPKPTALKKIAGNPGKRPLPKNEAKPQNSVKLPKAPHHLSKIAKKEWRRTSKELFDLGLLTNLDTVAFTAYCVCYATWLDAQANIQKHGVLIKAQSGFPMQSPYLAISNKAMAEMRKWLIEFGMTPSSRVRISVEASQEKDPMEEFLNRGGKPYEVK